MAIDSSKQLAFYFDQTRCMACNVCTVACKDWNQVNPGKVRWREQFTHEKGNGFYPLSMGCNHCDDPACVDACATQAISKDENTGVVVIDPTKCINLLSCIAACPFAKPQIADDNQEPTKQPSWAVQHPAQKCTMCLDRLAAGEKPACVTSCVGRALDHDTVDNITSRYPDAVKLSETDADFDYAYTSNKTATGPNFYVKKKTAQPAIHKGTSYQG